MPIFTTIPVNDASNERIDTFGGYNHNMKIGDGEFFDMKNLCSDEFPLLANRRKRGVSNLKIIQDMADMRIKDVRGAVMDAEGNLFVVAKGVFEDSSDSDAQIYKINKVYTFDGNTYRYSIAENYSNYTGSIDGENKITLTDDAKQMFCTGDRICIFPDKKWISVRSILSITEQGERVRVDYGNMDAHFQWAANNYSVTYKPCNSNGEVYAGQTVSNTAPDSPSEGAIWVDTSGGKIVWKQWASAQWISIVDVYTKIEVVNDPYHIFAAANYFNEGDGIELSIAEYSGTGLPADVEDLNGSHILIKKLINNDFTASIVVTGLLKEAYTQSNGTFKIERKIPDMDIVIQCQNRLWGCKFSYTTDDSKSLNEIYASKLGDFNNWNVFQGISTDSYVASVGTPGKWTGAANINGYPTFFKEDHFHKVYVSSSGAHQIIDKPCHGVQDNCGGSVVVVGDVCYYKSKSGVMAFDGATFSNIGAAFGRTKYVAADGGAVSDKYYISMQDEAGEWAIFAYDTRKGLWHKEDNTHALHFCNSSGDSFFYTEANGETTINIVSEFEVADNYEGPLEWEAVTGLQGYGYTGQKYISRFNLRMQLPRGSEMDVFVEYNSDGIWHHQGHIKGTGTKSFILPVRPRRCDHFRIKLSGKGEVRIYSFAKYFEGGSDII